MKTKILKIEDSIARTNYIKKLREAFEASNILLSKIDSFLKEFEIFINSLKEKQEFLENVKYSVYSLGYANRLKDLIDTDNKISQEQIKEFKNFLNLSEDDQLEFLEKKEYDFYEDTLNRADLFKTDIEHCSLAQFEDEDFVREFGVNFYEDKTKELEENKKNLLEELEKVEKDEFFNYYDEETIDTSFYDTQIMSMEDLKDYDIDHEWKSAHSNISPTYMEVQAAIDFIENFDENFKG